MADSNIQSFIPNFVAVRAGSADNQSGIQGSRTKMEGEDSFMKRLSETTEKNFNTGKDTDVKEKQDTSAYDKMQMARNAAKKLKELEERAAKEAGLANVDHNVQIQEKVAEFKGEIAEKLGITVDELNQVMEVYGFTDVDLFDGNVLGQIFLDVFEMDSMREMLFNENSFVAFKSALALIKDTLAEIKVISEKTEMSYGSADKPETEEVKLQELPEEAVTETENSQEYDGNAENPRDFTERKERGDKVQNSVDLNENAANVKFSTLENIESELSQRVGDTRATHIISQINDQIKINVNTQFKSMEMQLYPEHLGKVGVQVAVKEGIVTAQITAENEAVKKVIEAQIANLKENFNNQGLKVENVEVTIASHSFEENGMNNGRGEENQKESRRGKKVDSSLLDEINGIKEETADESVMETLGNTVSYEA